jgi:hypothetical protein
VKRNKRYNTTLGKLFFIIPVLVIGILVVYAYVNLSSPGTIIVRAETNTGAQLQVPVTVNGKVGETPWSLSTNQGNYVVNFTSVQWYYPPASRDVGVLPGQTVYAVALYSPIGKVIKVTPSGFNATTVIALHGVTPVNWTNPTSSLVTFEGAPFQVVPLEPGQTFSYIFPSAGSYQFAISSTNDTVTVDVS